MSAASILSVNVGKPRDVLVGDRTVRTGIFKDPVLGRVHLGRLGLDGDGQADTRVHGGPHRAAYAYPFEHYAFWRPRLGGGELPFGQFGENLTLSGVLEDQVCVGDVLEMGTARVQISAPRGPCFKLGIRTGDAHIVKPFLASGRLGFYLRVLEEGTVAAGDPVSVVERDPEEVTMAELITLLYSSKPDPARLARALRIESLMPGVRQSLERRVRGEP